MTFKSSGGLRDGSPGGAVAVKRLNDLELARVYTIATIDKTTIALMV